MEFFNDYFANMTMEFAIQSVVLSVLGGTVFYIITFKLAVIKQYMKRAASFYKLKNFDRRGTHFHYDIKDTNDTPILKVHDHLSARTLYGVVEPPSIYGEFKGNSSGSREFISITKQKTEKSKRLNKWISNCIAPYRIKEGNNKNWIENINVYYIFNKVLESLFFENTPQLVVIRGKVGCGKSTLVMDLGSKITEQLQDSKGRTLVVTVNVRNLLIKYFEFNENYLKNIFSPNFNEDAIEVVQREVVRLLVKSRVYGVSIDNSLNSAIEGCYTQRIKPLIILDELDFLYTDFVNRIVADKNGPKNQCLKVYQKLFTSICSIHRELPAARGTQVGLNTLVVVCARSSTKKLIDDVVDENTTNDIKQIKIDEANNNSIIDILSRQLDIIIELSSGTDAREVKALKETLNSTLNPISFENNIAISVHGVRHFMNTVCKLFDNGNNSSKLLCSILSKPKLLELYQYIDGGKHYSQAYEGISNIFLVNRDSPKRIKESNSTADDFDSWLLKDHLQTYWLKYFIFTYIYQKNKNDSVLQFNDVISIFHNKNSEKNTQYEQSIIKLALIHASKVDHGRLVKFGYEQGLTLHSSSRLKTMKDKNIFWDFNYLMAIIEDKWLEFPTDLYDKLKKEDGFTVYDFLINFHINESKEKFSFIEHKAKKVLLFFLVLKISLSFEIKRYSAVFLRLKEQGIDIDIMDDFEEHLRLSIIEFTRENAGDSYVSKINVILNNYFQNKDNHEQLIREYYRKYENTPPFKNIENKMDLYFTSLDKIKVHHKKELVIDE